MIKKISRAVSFLVISIFLTTATIFSGINPGFAAGMGPEMNEDNSMSIVIEESKDSLDDSNTSAAPDLGDDQAFPFIPGFGKNSGKD